VGGAESAEDPLSGYTVEGGPNNESLLHVSDIQDYRWPEFDDMVAKINFQGFSYKWSLHAFLPITGASSIKRTKGYNTTISNLLIQYFFHQPGQEITPSGFLWWYRKQLKAKTFNVADLPKPWRVYILLKSLQLDPKERLLVPELM
jgi:hypothetical protein